MTSTIAGDIRPEIGYERIFRALFPSGSVTGAPKVRAMQLLAQIEAAPRDIYTGAIGYFSREQTVFNVAIRSLSLAEGVGTMGVGSGIVIDSDPKVEYQECRLKAEFLARPPENFSLIETMFWEGGYPLLELHLDRLADSARYFDRPCDCDEIREALLSEAGGFPNDRPRKVRLLLDATGAVRIESEGVFRVMEVSAEPVRACIAARRTDPADRFLFHKTTQRALYDAAFANATAAGFADAIFLNTRGEVTEGAISNLFIEKSGHWYTPPLDCGVLPGVYRRHLLESSSEIRERILTVDDLKAADCVYISNAVRGLRKVTIDFDSIV
jgi:para-aminobenzoate synthetase/4-amino-4-deoxychorismate lyase